MSSVADQTVPAATESALLDWVLVGMVVSVGAFLCGVFAVLISGKTDIITVNWAAIVGLLAALGILFVQLFRARSARNKCRAWTNNECKKAIGARNQRPYLLWSMIGLCFAMAFIAARIYEHTLPQPQVIGFPQARGSAEVILGDVKYYPVGDDQWEPESGKHRRVIYVLGTVLMACNLLCMAFAFDFTRRNFVWLKTQPPPMQADRSVPAAVAA